MWGARRKATQPSEMGNLITDPGCVAIQLSDPNPSRAQEAFSTSSCQASVPPTCQSQLLLSAGSCPARLRATRSPNRQTGSWSPGCPTSWLRRPGALSECLAPNPFLLSPLGLHLQVQAQVGPFVGAFEF